MGKFKNCNEEIEALQNWAQSDIENRAVLVITAERNGDGMMVSGALRGPNDAIVPALGQYIWRAESLLRVIVEAYKYYSMKKMTSDESKGN